jgi:hypothetical protein
MLWLTGGSLLPEAVRTALRGKALAALARA